MKRREFIVTAGLGSISLYVNPACIHTGIKIKTARDLNAFLRSLYPIDPSVDRIIVGDPETVIRKAGTLWMPYFSTLKEAVSRGVNVLVVHEPTFYAHWDLDAKEHSRQPSDDKPSPYNAFIEEKKKWIEDNGLVIIRNHDVMDIIKDIGMPYALGQKLGFDNKDIIRSKDYYNVYQVETDSAWNIAKNIASKLRDFNQPGVAFYGDPERPISSIGMGAGMICDPQVFADMQPDLYLAVDDTIRAWIQGTYAEDTGIPLVVINHGTSEENGMRLLNEFLSKTFPEFEFIHFNQGCSYKWITNYE